MAVEKNGYRLVVKLDEFFDLNPREDMDNLTKMICFHKRYNLGDTGHDLKSEDFSGWDEMEEYIREKYNPVILKPLFLYDHSGITISTSRAYPFNCRWDAGPVGFVFIDQEGLDLMGLENPSPEDLDKYLEAEVELYDDYLQGNVYRFEILERITCDACNRITYETVECIGGFYGSPEKSGMLDYIEQYGFTADDLDEACE